MDKIFHFQSVSYHSALKAEGIPYKEDEKSLNAGVIVSTCGLAVFVSCRTIDTPVMLKQCLPFLKKHKYPFRLIKNQNLQYKLNSGIFGKSIIRISSVGNCPALVYPEVHRTDGRIKRPHGGGRPAGK
jgi:hypothetical protein